VHYRSTLVHSLWEQLWIEKLFFQKYGSDVGKRCLHLVDTKIFMEFFIHSPCAELGIRQRREWHIRAEIFSFGDGCHALAAN
jgi:hypothetical protein